MIQLNNLHSTVPGNAIKLHILKGLEDTAKASDYGYFDSDLNRGEPYSCATGIVAIKAERLMAAGVSAVRPYGEKSSRMQARAPSKVPRLSVLKVLPSFSLPLLPSDSSKYATTLFARERALFTFLFSSMQGNQCRAT